MKSVLRPTTPDDLPAVSEFLLRVFGAAPEAPFLQPPMMRWRYWEPRGDWSEPRAYVLERDGVITAHVGLWPMVYGGARGVQMIDWASSPDAPGAGLLLVQKFSAMFDFIYSIGGSEMTRKILPAYGFVEYAHQWRAARPLRPFRQILTHQTRNWKLIPRLARNLNWSLRPRAAFDSHTRWSFTEASPSELAAAQHLAPRSAGFLEYLSRCPAADIRIFAVENNSGPFGHFALSSVRGQARLAGMWLREATSDSRRAVLQLAQMAAKTLPGLYEFVAAGTGEGSRTAAMDAGLRAGNTVTPVYLMNRKGQLHLPPDFQFQLADADHFFMDSGGPSYWT